MYLYMVLVDMQVDMQAYFTHGLVELTGYGARDWTWKAAT